MPEPDRNYRFPFQRPEIAPPLAWGERLKTSYGARRFSNHGPLALEFEDALAKRVGRAVVLACNGTAAITAALLALQRTGGVILPSFTFPATLGAVLQARLDPVFADVDAQTWELSVETVERAAHAYARPIAAVLGVRTFGLCRDWSALQAWCDAQEIALVLDSAAALGGELPDGTPAGGQARMETFSLHATKVFAVGEGGAIACEPQDVPQLRRIMNFGLDDGKLRGWGFNGKVSEFTAAIGLAQNAALDVHLHARRSAAHAYGELLGRVAPDWRCATLPGKPPWQAYPVLAPSAELADRFERSAAQVGVQVRRYYRPALQMVDELAPFAHGQRLNTSADLAQKMVCLPMYSVWREGELDAILDAFAAAFAEV
jgi:dTDP-4-amino-4,6-dideoxygalactose transaminase